MTPLLEELTVEEARLNGFYGLPGDGAARLIGPTLVAAGVDGQMLVLDVMNTGNVDADYRLELDVDWLASPATVTVPADSTMRMQLPLTIAAAGGSATPVTASLYNGDELLSTSKLQVNVVDLSDDRVAGQVRASLDELDSNPPEGIDPDVIGLLQTSLRPAVDAAAATTGGNDSGQADDARTAASSEGDDSGFRCGPGS